MSAHSSPVTLGVLLMCDLQRKSYRLCLLSPSSGANVQASEAVLPSELAVRLSELLMRLLGNAACMCAMVLG